MRAGNGQRGGSDPREHGNGLGCRGTSGVQVRVWDVTGRTRRSRDAPVPVPCSGLLSCCGSRGAQDSPSLSSCVLSWIKTGFAPKPPSQSSAKEFFFPEPGSEVGAELKQINLCFIVLGLGFFVSRSALGSLSSLPTFTFKGVSAAEQRNFCCCCKPRCSVLCLPRALLRLLLAWAAAGRGCAGSEMLQPCKV